MARICMIAYADYAGDNRIRREAEALVDRGDVVHLVCPRTEALAGRPAVGGVELHYTRTFEHSAGAGPLGYAGRYLAFLLAAGVKVARLHLAHRYDVVQVHTMPDFLVFAALVPKLQGARIVLDVHDLVPELYATKFGLAESHLVVRALTWVERRSIGFAHRAIAVHKPHRDVLVRHGNPESKLTVVMNSPDLRLFGSPAEPREDDRFVLVYHGTISRRHGLETAIRAVAMARTEITQLELRIMGDGDDLPRIAALAEELGLRGVVTFSRGVVPLEELLPILRQASAGVVPLHSDSFTKYMLPVKLLEYVALGIPVLCSRTETIESYFDDSMLAYVRPGDAEDMAQRIVQLYREPAAARQLAARAATVVERHSWRGEKERYLEVIDSVTGGRLPDRAAI